MANDTKYGYARKLAALPGSADYDVAGAIVIDINNFNQISFSIFYTPTTAANVLNYKIQFGQVDPEGGEVPLWSDVSYIENETLTPGTDQVNESQKLTVSYTSTAADAAGNADGFNTQSFIPAGSFCRILLAETTASGGAGTAKVLFFKQNYM